MSNFMSWLFHRGSADASQASLGEASVTSHALWEEDTGQEPRMAPLTPQGGLFVGLTHPTGGPLLVDFAALVPESRMCVESVALPHGAAHVRMKLTLFKALPDEVWQQVTNAYRNRLEHAKLREAELRSRIGGCLQAGSIFED